MSCSRVMPRLLRLSVFLPTLFSPTGSPLRQLENSPPFSSYTLSFPLILRSFSLDAVPVNAPSVSPCFSPGCGPSERSCCFRPKWKIYSPAWALLASPAPNVPTTASNADSPATITCPATILPAPRLTLPSLRPTAPSLRQTLLALRPSH
jgi:hypothetical protein